VWVSLAQSITSIGENAFLSTSNDPISFLFNGLDCTQLITAAVGMKSVFDFTCPDQACTKAK
jgi:hypothetical protein